ncbi:unnamed protein product [Lactuca virosa]|uniref:Uncharacterized protein n=1 Tax=Lactuca virosa TaxID=75947 RepID=A0AAU9MVL7_9ASTR|nr:unnamed protein product [Lactuca virosa]
MGNSSNNKSDPPLDVDVGGEFEVIRGSTIPDSPVKSTGVALLSSKSIHHKPTLVPPYPSSKGASSATSTEHPKHKVRLSDSSAIGGVFPRSSPNKMHTSRSSPGLGQGVLHPVLGLPPPDLSLSGKALHNCSVTSEPAAISVVDAILSSLEVPHQYSEATIKLIALQLNSYVTTAMPLPSGSTSKARYRRSELA